MAEVRRAARSAPNRTLHELVTALRTAERVAERFGTLTISSDSAWYRQINDGKTDVVQRLRDHVGAVRVLMELLAANIDACLIARTDDEPDDD